MLIRGIHRFYDRKLRSYRKKLYAQRTQFVLGAIRTSSNLLILGARDAFVGRIVRHTGGGLVYYLVDKAPLHDPPENFVFRESDLNEKIPFDDDGFECVSADQVIEHLVRPDTFLREVHRVSKDGATLLHTSENLSAWHNIFALLLGYHPFSDHYSEYVRVGNPLSPRHLKPFTDPLMRHAKLPTVRALEELLNLNGFAVEQLRGFGHFLPLGNRLDPYHAFQFVFVTRVRKSTLVA